MLSYIYPTQSGGYPTQNGANQRKTEKLPFGKTSADQSFRGICAFREDLDKSDRLGVVCGIHAEGRGVSDGRENADHAKA